MCKFINNKCKLYLRQWKEKYEVLDLYRENSGHVSVPQRYRFDLGLGSWVGRQRMNFSLQKNIEIKNDFLNLIGFKWKLTNKTFFSLNWKKKYIELKYFKLKYGHCIIPFNNQDYKKLSFWVKNQRQLFRNNKLGNLKKYLLDQLGFAWNVKKSSKRLSWMMRFRELTVYFHENGNSNVPQRKGPLGKWVHRQRELHKKNHLKIERKHLLDSILFKW